MDLDSAFCKQTRVVYPDTPQVFVYTFGNFIANADYSVSNMQVEGNVSQIKETWTAIAEPTEWPQMEKVSVTRYLPTHWAIPKVL